ncbi:hypothetical protein HDU90_002799 [Geranomyces variabilis]|nr:hypothetical protein HDU90_002799 [Geranomyces variabilis]
MTSFPKSYTTEGAATRLSPSTSPSLAPQRAWPSDTDHSEFPAQGAVSTNPFLAGAAKEAAARGLPPRSPLVLGSAPVSAAPRTQQQHDDWYLPSPFHGTSPSSGTPVASPARSDISQRTAPPPAVVPFDPFADHAGANEPHSPPTTSNPFPLRTTHSPFRAEIEAAKDGAINGARRATVANLSGLPTSAAPAASLNSKALGLSQSLSSVNTISDHSSAEQLQPSQGVKELARAYAENSGLGGGLSAGSSPGVSPLQSGKSFAGWVTFDQNRNSSNLQSTGGAASNPDSTANPALRITPASEFSGGKLASPSPLLLQVPGKSPLAYSMSAGEILGPASATPRQSPGRTNLSAPPISATEHTFIPINLPRVYANDGDDDDAQRRSSTASDPFGDEHDIGGSPSNGSDESLEEANAFVPPAPPIRAPVLIRPSSAGNAHSNMSPIHPLAKALTTSNLTGSKPPPATPVRLVKPSFPPPPIPTTPSSASFANAATSLSTGPSDGLPMSPLRRRESTSLPSSPRGSYNDLNNSSAAGSPQRPPLPPRPVSPMLRAALSSRQLSPPAPGMTSRDASPLVPTRPVAKAVEDALLEYAQSQAHMSMASLNEPGMGGGAVEDRFAGLRREKLYSPDNISTNRRLPVAEGLPNSDLYLKHSARCFAVSGFYACTGGEKVRVWYIPSGDNIRTISVGETKIHAMAFAPTHYIEDEGRYLWVSLDKGEIIEIDITTGEIVDRKTLHAGTVTHIMRHCGQMWTIDDAGSLKVWSEDADRKRVMLQQRPRGVRVAAKQTIAFVAGANLWSAAGKIIEVHRPGEDVASCFQQRFDLSVTVGVGNVSCFASTRQGNTIFSGHDDGKILVWDAIALVKKRIVNAGMYPVTSLLGLGDRYLWAGHSTGKIHIYDVEHIDGHWSALKEFQAYHSASVDELVMDERSVFLSGRLQVASLSYNGQIRIWDGFLSRDWLENQLRLRERECCTYRDLKLLICSWNLDANKPAELEESKHPEDADFLARWMGSADSPDIIVVGFQELVDLESKKVTAKQLLKGTKKSQQSHMDHRFKLWREALIKSVRNAQPRASYRLLECRQLVGLFQCVFIKESEGARLKDVAVDMVKTGLKGYHGNKGGIATRFVLDDSSFCFVNTHLAAHQNQISARNNDVATILKDAHFPARPAYEGIFIGGGDGSMVLDHENVFWSGDLNYRIDLARERVIELVEQQDWTTLQEHDQLLNQMSVNPSFGLRGFLEGQLNFAPTFKYDVGTDRYDTSEKRRVPSWCDRVLFCSPHAVQTSYCRYETSLSDHRPISATFTARVKSVNAAHFKPVKQDVEAKLQAYLQREIEAEKVAWLVGRENMDPADASRILGEAGGELKAARDRMRSGAHGVG